MAYETQTQETILRRMLARVPDQMDKRESSLIWDTHSSTAIELQNLYIELDAMIKNSYGSTAEREYLILLCRDRGITPEPATQAVLRGRFTPEKADVIGKRFNIDKMNYVVTGKIADGEYEVRCETAGEIGNQYLGEMIPMEYIAGLQTAALTEVLIPGEDEEDTEALRQRYLSSFDEKAFGGNRADYIAKVTAIPGVGSVKVTRDWNGDLRPGEMIPTAAVSAWYESLTGLEAEVQEWLKTIYTAALEKKLTVGGTVGITIVDSDDFGVCSDLLVDTVQTTLDPEQNAGEGYGLAPIGHVVLVRSAAAVKVQVQTTLTFEEGVGWDNLKQSISAAVDHYLLDLRKEWADLDHLTVRISRIEAEILGIRGIVDIEHTALNGQSANLVLGEYEIPVLGGVGE